jgi:ubiquinone/menaquinone biosynthesis C-methylase UbiE
MSLHSYIAKQFSNPTGRSGKMLSSIMNYQNQSLYTETIQLLSLSDLDSVLDIGCGNGYVLNLLARQYNSAFTGIDTSPSIIQAASRRNHRFVENGRMEFLCQDVNSMSFADGSFHKAYSINTVYFWDDLNSTMFEIWRVLKPNGVFMNTLYSNESLATFAHTQCGYKRYTREQLTNAGTNAGFSVHIVPVLHGTAYCFCYQRMN